VISLAKDPVLRSRTFRRLFLARLVSNIGNGIALVGLPFAILELDNGTSSTLGWLLAAQGVGIVLFLPIGGIVADRVRRPMVIATTDFILGLLLIYIAYLFSTHHVELLWMIILQFGCGVLNAFWWPAFPGLTPLTVSETDLTHANSFISMASNVGMVSGSALAGWVVAQYGGYAAIYVDAATFLLAALLVFPLRHLHQPAPSDHESFFDSLIHGWKTFLSFRWVVVVVGSFSIIVMVWRGAIGVLGPVLMKESFDGPRSWSIIATAETIGYIVSSLIATRYKPKRPLLFCSVLTIFLAIYVGMLRPGIPLWVIALAGFIWGIAIESWTIHWSTALQVHIPRESLSRVSSFDAMGSLMFGPIGVAAAGIALGSISIGALSLIGAVIIGFMVIVMVLEPQVRHLTNTL